MSSVGFMLPYSPSLQYEALIKQFEKDKHYAEVEGRVLSEKEWKRHWRLMEAEWAKMVGLKKSKRHPSLESLKNKQQQSNTPVPNQDHASIWSNGRKPMMLVSMPNTKAPARYSDDQIKAFEQLHKVKRYRMSFPGWYNPPATALDVWVLD
jgi:hypothetical protein